MKYYIVIKDVEMHESGLKLMFTAPTYKPSKESALHKVAQMGDDIPAFQDKKRAAQYAYSLNRQDINHHTNYDFFNTTKTVIAEVILKQEPNVIVNNIWVIKKDDIEKLNSLTLADEMHQQSHEPRFACNLY